MMTGAILTVGDSVGSEVFFLKNQSPDRIAFICTGETKHRTDEICKQAEIPIGEACQFFQIQDIADEPDSSDERVMTRLAQGIEEAHRWLREECEPDAKILINPTAGRKWMSAGLVLYASRCNDEILYVHTPFEGGKPLAGKERIVKLGNVDDYAATGKAALGVALFNRGDFAGAEEVFAAIDCASSARRELYRGLAKISRILAAWDRLQHFSPEIELKAELSKACKEVRRSANDASISLDTFVDSVIGLSDRIAQVSAYEGWPSIEAVSDLFFNACRRLDAKRYDDGVARLYRAVEATAQWLLSLRKLNSSDLDWSQIDDDEKKRYFQVSRDKINQREPKEIGLESACMLADSLKIKWNLVDDHIKNEFCDRHRVDPSELPDGLPLSLLASREDEVSIAWSLVAEEKRNEEKERREGNLLGSLPLRDAVGFGLPAIEAAARVFINTDRQPALRFKDHLHLRNNSILAHGWRPLAEPEKEQILKFREIVKEILDRLGADLTGWELEKLPELLP